MKKYIFLSLAIIPAFVQQANANTFLFVSPLQTLPQWVTYLFTTLLVLVALWLGYRLAIILKKKNNIIDDGPANTLAATVMGLLAFILAFAFGATTNRFDARKALLLDEVNAIETAYLRSDLIPAEYQSHSKELLKEYVDQRIRLIQAPDSLEYFANSALNIQKQLWDISKSLAADTLQNADIVSLYIDALNTVIEMQTNRYTVGITYKIPELVWLLIYILTLFSMVSMGYIFGLKKELNWYMFILLAIAFSAVIILITDLDKSGATSNSIIRISQQPMFDLQKRLLMR